MDVLSPLQGQQLHQSNDPTMIYYERHSKQSDGTPPGSGDDDLASRQQTFASEGDAIFFPKSKAQPPRTFESAFIAPPPCMGNPYNSTGSQSQLRQHPQQNAITLSPSPHNRHLGYRPSQPDLSLLRTGNAEARNSNRSSPSPSLESTNQMSNQIAMNKVGNGNIVTAANSNPDATTLQNVDLPLIPDIRKDSKEMGRPSIPVRTNQSEEGRNSLFFSCLVPSCHAQKNSKFGRIDLLLKIVVQVSSKHSNGSLDSTSSHTVYKWYSDISLMHERLGMNQHSISFPVVSFSRNTPENSPLSESDRSELQSYFTALADSFLNVDVKMSISQQVMSFLENESNSLSDKVRMLSLETRLLSTMTYCNQLQNRLQIAEQNQADNAQVINFFRYRIEQLEKRIPSARVSDAPVRQPEQLQAFQQQGGNNCFSVQNGQNSLNYSNVDAMFTKNMRIHEGMKNNNFPAPEGNNVDPSELVALAENVLNEKGPLPVGEVGKMLQEHTGNPHLSQVLKERHNGLKKFLEKYCDKFIMSCDHPFNPHVYLRRSYSPEDQRMIESGSTAFLDKKGKKPRRKEKKTWPTTVVSPTIGSYQARIYSS